MDNERIENNEKKCHKCSQYLCESGIDFCRYFGRDIPTIFKTEYGCCLHPNEVKKVRRLVDRHIEWVSRTNRKEKVSEHELQMSEKTLIELREYMEHLKNKYGGMEG